MVAWLDISNVSSMSTVAEGAVEAEELLLPQSCAIPSAYSTAVLK